jgi:hypothetical protein
MPDFPSLSETLLLRTGGGVYATWSASGLSENTLAVRLNQAFFQVAFVDNEKVLGDIILRVLRETDATGSEYMRFMYNLLGEPVSRLPERLPR